MGVESRASSDPPTRVMETPAWLMIRSTRLVGRVLNPPLRFDNSGWAPGYYPPRGTAPVWLIDWIRDDVVKGGNEASGLSPMPPAS
jgi:hypothetical protein